MIKLENVSKFYYSANAVVPALRKIKLEFQVGEFVVITGESGSGKSTLLNIISGLDTYDDGEFYINGEGTSDYDAADWEHYRKHKIGFVFQNFNLIEHYTVLSNVESALLIQGYEIKEAKRISKELISKVGLSKQLHQKASKLSTGQKQRLSIARALAKNTEIIIADEPTGNLDSENGKQIMQLLSELSKDRLIITVTHNHEEAEPYTTRKIRLHDGEVVSDIRMNTEVKKDSDLVWDSDPKEAVTESSENNTELKGTKLQVRNKHNDKRRQEASINNESSSRIAWRFTRMNMITQPGRMLLYLMLLILTAGIMLVFMGDIISHLDDTVAKQYDNTMFMNSQRNRIVVKKPDGTEINQKDIDNFQRIKYVKMSDPYDYANDIHYYILEGMDYEYDYRPSNNLKDMERSKKVDFLPVLKFVKSSACITEEDLAAGTLPKERNEIVIYSEDPGVLGLEQDCYFSCLNAWGQGQYYSVNVKVVGILKEYTDQVYFSTQLCEMLTVAMYDDNYSLAHTFNMFTNTYRNNVRAIPVIGEGLQGHQIRVSTDLGAANDSNMFGTARLSVFRNDMEPLLYEDTEILPEVHMNSSHFIEVGEEWFYELFQQKSKQASLYIDDYIHTDYVLKKLHKLGYDAISPLRTGAGDYVGNLQMEYNIRIIRAFLVLLIMSILEIIVVSSTMRFRSKDISVLASIGMERRVIKLMNYYEMYCYTVISVLLIIIAANISRLFINHEFISMMKYFNAMYYAIYLAMNFVVITFTVGLFHRYLRRKQKWS